MIFVKKIFVDEREIYYIVDMKTRKSRKKSFALQFYLRRSKRYNEDGSSEEETKQDNISLPGHRLPSSYRGTWPIRRDVWANQQIGFPAQQSTSLAAHNVS